MYVYTVYVYTVCIYCMYILYVCIQYVYMYYTVEISYRTSLVLYVNSLGGPHSYDSFPSLELPLTVLVLYVEQNQGSGPDPPESADSAINIQYRDWVYTCQYYVITVGVPITGQYQ
jgi:hypothetical protein